MSVNPGACLHHGGRRSRGHAEKTAPADRASRGVAVVSVCLRVLRASVMELSRSLISLSILHLVEAEHGLRSADQNRTPDEIRLLHHQVDGFLLRLRQGARLEDRAPFADVVQEVLLVDVLFEKCAVGRILVDVPLLDVDPLLLQKTSGVAAGRSRGFPVEGWRHRPILSSTFRIERAVLTINEIFHSIQGESTHAGRPCVFVRLTACDLRCSWCDTPYAFHEGRKMPVDEVVAQVKAYDCPVVEVTGGEPLLQQDVYPLMQRLLDDGLTVMLETGGHRSIEQVPAGVIRIMDVKCPGSGESDRNDWSNMARLTATDEVKFVIKD